MNEFEVLVPILAILVTGAAVLIPIVGITARFALKPVVEAFARLKESQGAGERQALMEQRIALLEEQLHAMERDQARLLEEADFRRQLGQPADPGR
jgi:hypothetical protein